MKKIKILLGLSTMLLFTGCASKEIKTIYNKMLVGKEKEQINGYYMSLNINGLIDTERYSQTVWMKNYMDKNFEIEIDKDIKTTYFVKDGVNYKNELKENYKEEQQREEDEVREEESREEETKENEEMEKFEDLKNELMHKEELRNSYEVVKTKDKIPFVNEKNLFLETLKNSKKYQGTTTEEITNKKYKVHTFKVSKKAMTKALADSALKDVKIKKDVNCKLWEDKDGYVYKIEFDLDESVEKADRLTVSAIFVEVNNSTDINVK